ncbi:MAG: hypothetical protein KAU60_07475 [Desulfobacterales bacterium]|jgi:hypothetical protein|nr:hypothetical protein [Desulfobacterales bacterium]
MNASYLLLNLSDHALDINIRRCNYNKFSFPDIEDYVRELVGSRDYQYDAIKQIMIYLWGGSYKNITELGRVLVLGPASTIIEQGLREKFKELICIFYPHSLKRSCLIFR